MVHRSWNGAVMVSQWKRTNTLMLQEIKFVLNNTAKDDFVIDGFRGAGVFRPYVYYYHFVHVEVRMMMTEKELSTDIVSAMREERPKIAVYDGELQATSEAVRQYVQEHYTPTGVGCLYMLKEYDLNRSTRIKEEDRKNEKDDGLR